MWTRISAVLLVAITVCMPASATTVRPLTLDQIVGDSAIAFQGTVVSNRTARDGDNQVVTYTLFQVNDVLKGSVPASYEIKQIGGELSDGGVSFVVHGVPKFTPGAEYVVFMAGVSASGFSSPIGLSQGSFDVRPDASGGKSVANGRDFGDMTASIPEVQLPSEVAKGRSPNARFSEMNLDTFKSLVRNRVSTLRGPK